MIVCCGLVDLMSLTFSSEFSGLYLCGGKSAFYIKLFSCLISSIIATLSCLISLTIWMTRGLSSTSWSSSKLKLDKGLAKISYEKTPCRSIT